MKTYLKLGTKNFEISIPRRVTVDHIEVDVYKDKEKMGSVDYSRMFYDYRPGENIGIIIDLPIRNPFVFSIIDNVLSLAHSFGAYDDEITLFFTRRISREDVPPIYLYRYKTLFAQDIIGEEKFVTLATIEGIFKFEVHRTFERNLSKTGEKELNTLYVISDAYLDGIYGVRTPIISLMDFTSFNTRSALMKIRARLGLPDFVKNFMPKLTRLPPFVYVEGGISLIRGFMEENAGVMCGSREDIYEKIFEFYGRNYGYVIPNKYNIYVLGLLNGSLETLHRALVYVSNKITSNDVAIIYSDSWSFTEQEEEKISEALLGENINLNSEEDVMAYEVAKIISEKTIMIAGNGNTKIFEVFNDIQDAIDIALEKVMRFEPRPKIVVIPHACQVIPMDIVL